MKTSEHIEKISAALLEAQKSMKNPAKNGFNPHFKNKYADLVEVRESTLPHLLKNGLCITQGPDFADGKFFVTTRLIHAESGQWFEINFPLTEDQPQKMGSAISYGRRYSWAAICGVASDDDDDAEATRPQTNGRHTAPAPTKKPAPVQSIDLSKTGCPKTVDELLGIFRSIPDGKAKDVVKNEVAKWTKKEGLSFDRPDEWTENLVADLFNHIDDMTSKT